MDYHRYYNYKDGECTLNNPKVWAKCRKYVYRVIKSTFWIANKKFIEPDDLLYIVKEQLKDLKPFQYGTENYEPISFLCKKIATQLGREYWKHLKLNAPHLYEKHRKAQKTAQALYRIKHPEMVAKAQKKHQSKLRKEVSDHYVMQQVYAYLKYNTGMKYTFDEIRQQYPKLIEEKREKLLKRRAK